MGQAAHQCAKISLPLPGRLLGLAGPEHSGPQPEQIGQTPSGQTYDQAQANPKIRHLGLILWQTPLRPALLQSQPEKAESDYIT